MLKKLAISGIGLALLATPVFASALSADTLAKIDALLSQIKILQALIAQLQGGTQTSCVDLSANLTLGSSSDDVTSLQNYLIGKDYLNAQYNTGYYGFLTATAVGKMQVDLGIVSSANDTAYGIMGPKTRAAIACNGTTPTPLPPVGQPSATIDQSSLTASTGGKDAAIATITGTALNTDRIGTLWNGQPSGTVPVVNGYWSVTHGSLFPGTYSIQVLDEGMGHKEVTLTTGTLTVTGTSATAPTCTLYASPSTVTVGQTFTLYWTSQNATTASGLPTYDVNTVPVNGSQTVSVGTAGSSVYTISFSGTGGKTSCSATVTVTSAVASAAIDQSSLTASTGGKDAAAVTLSGSASNVSQLQKWLSG